MLFVRDPKILHKHCFSWGHFNSQEKLKTVLMQNFGVTNKEHYGMLWYFWSGQMKGSPVLSEGGVGGGVAVAVTISKFPE